MTRRVAGKVEEENSGNGNNKEIRRDSKGFEDFDDYFDSDANDTTAGDKTNEEEEESSVIQDDSVEESVVVAEEQHPVATEPEPEKGKEEINQFHGIFIWIFSIF